MTGGPLEMVLAGIEGQHLLAIVDEYVELLDGPRDAGDGAMRRLAPTAYPDDRDAADEFWINTREDLLDQRLSDALSVRTALEGFEEPPDGADERRTVDIDPVELDHWLRTLSGIRLVLATRLGIDQQDVHDDEDPRYGVYDWLGYRLELLVQQADQRDL